MIVACSWLDQCSFGYWLLDMYIYIYTVHIWISSLKLDNGTAGGITEAEGIVCKLVSQIGLHPGMCSDDSCG